MQFNSSEPNATTFQIVDYFSLFLCSVKPNLNSVGDKNLPLFDVRNFPSFSQVAGLISLQNCLGTIQLCFKWDKVMRRNINHFSPLFSSTFCTFLPSHTLSENDLFIENETKTFFSLIDFCSVHKVLSVTKEKHLSFI